MLRTPTRLLTQLPSKHSMPANSTVCRLARFARPNPALTLEISLGGPSHAVSGPCGPGFKKMNVGRAVATTLPAPISGSAGACHRTTIEIVIALVGSSVTAESPVGQVVERTELGRAAGAEIVGGVRQCGAKPIGAAIAGRDGGEIRVELGGLAVISC